MSLLDTFKNNMYKALKDGNKDKVRVLRALISKLKDKQIEKGNSLNEIEELKVVKNLVKQTKESIKIYKKADRSELADKENIELLILESYLPKMLSHQEIKDIVQTTIEKTGAKNLSDLGKVMPVIMKLGGILIDGKKPNIILRD
jgi:uncharacterized protein YqeY